MRLLCVVLMGTICRIFGHECQPPLSEVKARLGTGYFVETTMVNMSDGLRKQFYEFQFLAVLLRLHHILSGVRLSTNIYSRGKKTKPYPVVIDRSPYGS